MKKIIIIGAGTAGSVINKRLADFFDVTVFDQCYKLRIPYFYQVPLMIGLLFGKKSQYLRKISIEAPNNRKVPYFMSTTVGGASVMNGCVHVLGSRERWNRLLDRFRISNDELDKSYSDIYSKERGKEKIQLKLSRIGDLDIAFCNTLASQGFINSDMEWMDVPAVGSIYNTVERVFRSSVMSLNPFKKGELKIRHKVDNIVVDEGFNCIGVFANKKIYLADSVVVSCGVIGTAQLLASDVLRASDMKFIKSPFDAGTGIKDHANIRINVKASKRIDSLNEINVSLLKRISVFIQHVMGRKTLIQGTGATTAAHLDIDNDKKIDTRIHLLNFSENGRLSSDGNLFASNAPGFSISITVINPYSTGSIFCANGVQYIKPQYLSNAEDMKHLKKCIEFVINLLRKEPLKSFVNEIDDIDEILTNPERYIANNCFSGYHLIGGCASMVDHAFQIKNSRGLYVCDASILDEYVSSNIHSTVVLLADMFARRFIKYNANNNSFENN